MPKRFAFVIHPISAKDLTRLPIGRALAKLIGLDRTAKLISNVVPPFCIYNDIRVLSKTGETCEGILITLPATPKILKTMTREQITSKLLTCANIAKSKGCSIMGLGAYTSVAGDAGVLLSEKSPIGITTGNSLTVWSAFKTILFCTDKLSLQASNTTLTIIGATGSIGSAVTKLAAKSFMRLILIAPKIQKLELLKEILLIENPKIEIVCATEIPPEIQESRLIFTTTSAASRVIDLKYLKPGSVIIDVAMPSDIPKEDAQEYPNILVVAAGEILLPVGSHFKFNIGLGESEIFACMAETVALCLEGFEDNFTIGRDIKLNQVEQISKIAEKHGLKLGPLRSYGKNIIEEDWSRVNI